MRRGSGDAGAPGAGSGRSGPAPAPSTGGLSARGGEVITAASDKASSTARKTASHRLTAFSCARLRAAIGPPSGRRRLIDAWDLDAVHDAPSRYRLPRADCRVRVAQAAARAG